MPAKAVNAQNRTVIRTTRKAEARLAYVDADSVQPNTRSGRTGASCSRRDHAGDAGGRWACSGVRCETANSGIGNGAPSEERAAFG